MNKKQRSQAKKLWKSSEAIASSSEESTLKHQGKLWSPQKLKISEATPSEAEAKRTYVIQEPDRPESVIEELTKKGLCQDWGKEYLFVQRSPYP
jgi:hypothetical protein